MSNDKKALKVTFISHSDLLGGAGVVTWRLMQALNAKGVDARMIVYTKYSDSDKVAVTGSRFSRGWNFTLERFGILARNDFNRSDLFKVSVADHGMPLWRHPWVADADVINLSWINQGLLSLDGIRRIAALGKPIVWTMHDMWTMTGICHHAYECTRFHDSCGCCPFLKSDNPSDLSNRVWRQKHTLYGEVPVHFVAVSNWAAERARSSSLMKDMPVTVIPNAFPIESFMTEPIDDFPRFDPIPNRRRLIFGAARLDDPIKGLDTLIDALNLLFDNNPEIGINTGVILFGDIRDKSILDRLRFAVLNMGRVDDPRLLRQLYASSVAVLSTSRYETLPGTLIEGQASGCLPVTFGNGGQADIVTHLKDGYIARSGDVEDFANGIIWALGQKVDRRALHDSVGSRFGADSVADRYISLYESLL